MKKSWIFKFFIVLLVTIYFVNTEPTEFSGKMEAIFTLVLSILLLIKSKNNPIAVTMAFFITYCNYSIVMGEYIVGGDLAVPLIEMKTVPIYGVSIRLLLLFTLIVALFFKNIKKETTITKLKLLNSSFIYYSLIIGLIYAFVVGVDRTGDLSNYTVRISPLYEYSILIFLFAYYFSGNSKAKKTILFLLGLVFVLQDFYYGGRITALQIIFFLLYTLFVDKLSFKPIIVYGLIGIFVNALIGAFRNSRVLESDFFVSTFNKLIESFFVFETPIYAYYATATHVAATNVIPAGDRIESLIAFLRAIFLGSNIPIGNVTYYVSQNYYVNIGGGIIPSYFYFWMGWSGVIISGLIVVGLLNSINEAKNNYLKLIALTFAMTLPRWYVYSPLMIFRPILFTSLLYFFLTAIHLFFVQMLKKNSSIKTIY